MSFIYKWNVSNGDDVEVEYCFSSKDNCVKVVEMWVNGKFHRLNWMSKEGRDTLMGLLEEDYNNRMSVTSNLESRMFDNFN